MKWCSHSDDIIPKQWKAITFGIIYGNNFCKELKDLNNNKVSSVSELSRLGFDVVRYQYNERQVKGPVTLQTITIYKYRSPIKFMLAVTLLRIVAV